MTTTDDGGQVGPEVDSEAEHLLEVRRRRAELLESINALEQAAARGDRGSTRQLANAKPELVAHILTETERLNDIVEKFINLAEFSPESLTRLFHLQEERPA